MYLNLFEITNVKNTYVRRLSAGQRKLATTLPAIASHPKVLLDEPFEQIDPARKVKLAQEIVNLASRGATVVLNAASVGVMLGGRYFGSVKPASELLDSYLVMEKPSRGHVMLEIDADGRKAYITRRAVKGANPLEGLKTWRSSTPLHLGDLKWQKLF